VALNSIAVVNTFVTHHQSEKRINRQYSEQILEELDSQIKDFNGKTHLFISDMIEVYVVNKVNSMNYIYTFIKYT